MNRGVGQGARHGALLVAAAMACSTWLSSEVAAAHGVHPHVPGSPEDHPIGGPPQAPGPNVDNESLPTDAAPDASSPAAETGGDGPAAASGATASISPEAPPAEDDERVYRPRLIPNTSWRQRIRDQDEPASEYFDGAHFVIELRFGPYWPAVDDEPGLTGTPYADFFGTGPNFYFGLELDWLPLYIPHVASIGAGFGWGYTSASASAKVQSTGQDAGSDTSLGIFPMHLSAVARIDGPLRELQVPIAPYVKVGLGWGLWSASGPNAEDEGTSTGLHVALGGAVALNAFDRSAAMSMREDAGIRYAYLWGEWMFDNLGTFGSEQMYVGTSTAIFGLGLDF